MTKKEHDEVVETNNTDGFDHKVSKVDAKTGKPVGRNDYKLELSKDENGNTQAVYERPIGSGQKFHPNGVKIVMEGDIKTEIAVNEAGLSEAEFNKASKGNEDDSKKSKKADEVGYTPDDKPGQPEVTPSAANKGKK
jgi:hypothetical protein